MVDIPAIVLEAIKDSDALEEKLNDISIDLVANIQDQLVPGHGYITGDLHDSIQSDVAQDGMNGVVRAYTKIEYAEYVNEGTRPHTIVSKKGPGHYLNTPFGMFRIVEHPGTKGLHFMEKGLEETVAMYK